MFANKCLDITRYRASTRKANRGSAAYSKAVASYHGIICRCTFDWLLVSESSGRLLVCFDASSFDGRVRVFERPQHFPEFENVLASIAIQSHDLITERFTDLAG